jgi:hypothetical protein
MTVHWSHNDDGIKKADITVEKSNKHIAGNISYLVIVWQNI